jgi:hypothetical protein
MTKKTFKQRNKTAKLAPHFIEALDRLKEAG